MGTGGSRYGAGRPGHKLKAEATKRIDIRRWQRECKLKAGGSFTWAWTCNGEPVGNIGVAVESGAVRLIYSIQGHDNQWRDASQSITVQTTPCHYGGSRPWFACPICRDRAAVLYLRSGRFACRHCNRIAYQSQSGSMHHRVCNLYHRLADKLEDGKPKWQRWATFNRLEDRFNRVSRQFDASLFDRLSALGFA